MDSESISFFFVGHIVTPAVQFTGVLAPVPPPTIIKSGEIVILTLKMPGKS